MKNKTKVLIMLVVTLLAILVIGTTRVNATDIENEEGKFCMFTLHKANGDDIEILGSRRLCISTNDL